MYNQLIFVDSQFLGSGARSLRFIHGELQAAPSLTFICPDCGKQWATVVMQPIGGAKPVGWQPYMRLCRACGPKAKYLSEWPGCIWIEWDKDFLDALPTEALQYELEQHLRHLERVNHVSS